MDSLKQYWQLIETRKRLGRSGYLEKHHIATKSLYDSGILPTKSLDIALSDDLKYPSVISFLLVKFVFHF